VNSSSKGHVNEQCPNIGYSYTVHRRDSMFEVFDGVHPTSQNCGICG